MAHHITKSFNFEAAHVLPNYGGNCSRLHGHSYKLDVTVSGPLETAGSDRSMVLDFSKLSEVVKKLIVDVCDHRLLSARRHEPHVRALVDGGIPPNDIVVLDIPRTTAECLSKHFFEILQSHLEPTIIVDSVTVWETATGRATFVRPPVQVHQKGI